jgi:photoactive yellow protein
LTESVTLIFLHEVSHLKTDIHHDTHSTVTHLLLGTHNIHQWQRCVSHTRVIEHMNTIPFDTPHLLSIIQQSNADALDELNFGLIGFDAKGYIRVYNRFESQCSGFDKQRVIGAHVFDEIAICMNNYMVAQKFEDCQESGVSLDETLDYVLTFRMKPSKVKLRLLSDPHRGTHCIAVLRNL